MMEQEEALVIEKCVVYVKAPDSASRVSSAIVDGKNKIPITLPRVKCLDDEPGKYFPYTGVELLKIKEDDDEVGGPKGLTIRERESHRLHSLGVSVKDIARQFRESNDRIRRMISSAKNKLGERPFCSDGVRKGQPLSDNQRAAYEMHNQGMTYEQISKKLNLNRKSVTSMLRRARIKLGERVVKGSD